MDPALPVEPVHWALACLSLVVLALLLIWLRQSAAIAGAAGAAAATAVAVLAFRADAQVIAVAAGKGVWDALFVLYVVWPALLLYLIADRGGAFAALRAGIRRFSHNQLFQVLALGWVFVSFLQAIAGFGAPIAVVAPMLLAIGVKPLYAVVIPLIGHAWATMFGSVGVGWLATLRVIDMADPEATAWQTALLLWICNLSGGAAVAWLFGRGRALVLAVPLIAAITTIHGGVQLVMTFWQPVISNVLAATIALLALHPLSRWRRYREAAEDIETRPAMAGQGEPEEAEEEEHPPMGLLAALSPYVVLTAVAMAVLLLPGVEAFLEQAAFGPPVPEATTGYGVHREAEDEYSPIEPLTHPGFFLLIACAATWIAFRAKGFIAPVAREKEAPSLWRTLAQKAGPASLAIVAFLVMSRVLEHSGQTRVLALGLSAAMPSMAYAGIAAIVGALGAFITSSSTASNLVFAPLQQTVAEAEALPEPAIIAAQSAGGAVGNAVAPAKIVLGTSTAGLAGREGEVLRKALPWTAATAVVIGTAAVVLVAL